MASMMAKAGPSVRPSCGIQHRQPARPFPACRAVVRPVAQQTQHSVQQRKVRLNGITCGMLAMSCKSMQFVVTVESVHSAKVSHPFWA
jgi:hypothetical protein